MLFLIVISSYESSALTKSRPPWSIFMTYFGGLWSLYTQVLIQRFRSPKILSLLVVQLELRLSSVWCTLSPFPASQGSVSILYVSVWCGFHIKLFSFQKKGKNTLSFLSHGNSWDCPFWFEHQILQSVRTSLRLVTNTLSLSLTYTRHQKSVNSHVFT